MLNDACQSMLDDDVVPLNNAGVACCLLLAEVSPPVVTLLDVDMSPEPGVRGECQQLL